MTLLFVTSAGFSPSPGYFYLL